MPTLRVKSYIHGRKDHCTQLKSQKNLPASFSMIWLDKQYLVRRLNLTQVRSWPIHACNPAKWLWCAPLKYLFLFPLRQPFSDKLDVLKWWVAFLKLILQPCAHKDLCLGMRSFVGTLHDTKNPTQNNELMWSIICWSMPWSHFKICLCDFLLTCVNLKTCKIYSQLHFLTHCQQP